jgi:hypothetical protein
MNKTIAKYIAWLVVRTRSAIPVIGDSLSAQIQRNQTEIEVRRAVASKTAFGRSAGFVLFESIANKGQAEKKMKDAIAKNLCSGVDPSSGLG